MLSSFKVEIPRFKYIQFCFQENTDSGASTSLTQGEKKAKVQNAQHYLPVILLPPSLKTANV